MATLADSSTGYKNGFEKYVSKNPHWDKKTEYQVAKKIKDEPYFSLQGKLLGTLKDGDKLTIMEKTIYNKKMVTDTRVQRYLKIKIKAKHVPLYFKLNKIRKPISRSDVMSKEKDAILAVNRALKKIGHPITVRVKKTNTSGHFEFKNIIKCKDVFGTPKADFSLVDNRGRSLCFISHKAEGGPGSFQQYSGVTEKAGQIINKNKEVQEFLQEVIPFLKRDRLIHPLMKKIRSKKLMSYAIYGPDYGKSFGKENCHFIGQGDPIFTQDKRKKDMYYLTWSDEYKTNGDTRFPLGYEPQLAATFRTGRTFVFDRTSYRGARIGIVPKRFIEKRSGVVML